MIKFISIVFPLIAISTAVFVLFQLGAFVIEFQRVIRKDTSIKAE